MECQSELREALAQRGQARLDRRHRTRNRIALDTAATSDDTTSHVISMSDPSLLVLASLADGDKHGYAMMDDIRLFAGVDLGPGTLYGAITRLEERGFIAPVQSDDRRKPYRITAAGKRHLDEQLSDLEAIVRTGRRRLRAT